MARMGAIVKLFAFLLFVCAKLAWAGSITLVVSDNGHAYTEFTTALIEQLRDSSWSVAIAQGDASGGDIIITVGSDALQRTLARGEGAPIIATLISRQNYDRLLNDYKRPAGRITAITLDQPLGRVAAFARNLMPNSRRFGMLFSSETRSLSNSYRQAFSHLGLGLEAEDVDTTTNLLPALTNLLPRVGALIAHPDSTIYQRANIKPILISSFRLQRPVIGYSLALVQAGALAAIHTTPTQFAQQTAELLLGRPLPLPAPMGPANFSIAINQNVVQALNLSLPDEATIRRAMLADRDSR